MFLLERSEHLAALADAFAEVDGAGRLVLIGGEAGAGKSALVQAFRDEHLQGCRTLVGRCDDLFAPRPLGPLADIARERPGELGRALAAGDQVGAFEAFVVELASHPRQVVVLEDLQWADDATLDLLRVVGRRLDTLPCLILATHRDDLPADHPLRLVWGSLVGPRVTRVHLPPLSVAGVGELCGGTGIDPASLHARTGGNPFFVTEVLAGDPGTLPATVRDTVLARAARLSEPARDALDAAAVLGPRAGPALIQEVAACGPAAVDECHHAGLLVDESGGRQAFRHDLSRQAIEEAIAPLRRRRLHARALAALGDEDDLVRRAHHAVGAGDGPAILDLAARAADRCMALGAYREAATLLGGALQHAAAAPEEERRHLLELRAKTCERVEQLEEAIVAGEQLLALLAHSGPDAELGVWEGWLGSVYRCVGRGDDAWRSLRRAVGRLEPLGDSADLARALALLAQQQMNSGENAEAVRNSERAISMAERFDIEEVAVHAMDTCGAAMACGGDEAGLAVLAGVLRRAQAARVHHEVTRASNNLGEAMLDFARPAEALPALDAGMAIAADHDLRFNRNGMLTLRARAYMDLGRWDEAVADSRAVLRQDDLAGVNRFAALVNLGRIRARRGDPGPFELLDEALAIAMASAEMGMVHAALVAHAEAAWLCGDMTTAAADVARAIPVDLAHPEPLKLGELAVWARRAGAAWVPEVDVPDPYARLLAGDARGAAAWWEERSCRYDAADVLGESDDVDDLRRALDALVALGARPRTQLVTRRLRAMGVRDLPRGPRASTRSNAAGLTARELEVAVLVVDGLANAEIARRLVLSSKTVDHHVSSILAKLGAPNRRQVARCAATAGLDLAPR